MLYEIRNYHFEPELFEDYKRWAQDEAVPFLKDALDIVGFWFDGGVASEVTGKPMDSLGSANITWIIQWQDMADREARFQKAMSSPEFTEIFARVPGGIDSYLRMESNFMEAA